MTDNSQPSFWELPWGHFIFPLGLIVGGGFYCLSNKLLIRWLALPTVLNRSRHEKAVKTFFSWLAFFLFIALSSVLMHLAPQRQAHTYASKIPSSFWTVLAPALAAYLLYKLGVRIALRNSCVTTD